MPSTSSATSPTKAAAIGTPSSSWRRQTPARQRSGIATAASPTATMTTGGAPLTSEMESIEMVAL
jgi:hypothetical protein